MDGALISAGMLGNMITVSVNVWLIVGIIILIWFIRLLYGMVPTATRRG